MFHFYWRVEIVPWTIQYDKVTVLLVVFIRHVPLAARGPRHCRQWCCSLARLWFLVLTVNFYRFGRQSDAFS
jgi:hypothetical protein